MTVKFSRTTSMKTPTDTISSTQTVSVEGDSPGTVIIQDALVQASQTKEHDISFFGSGVDACFISTNGALDIGINGPYGGSNEGEFQIDATNPFSYMTGDGTDMNPFDGLTVTALHVTNSDGVLDFNLKLRMVAQTWND